MPIVNDSSELYLPFAGGGVRASLVLTATGELSITPRVRIRQVRVQLNLAAAANLNLDIQTRSDHSLNLRALFGIALSPKTGLVLGAPSPILRTVGAGNNSIISYPQAPKLFINNVAVPYISAEINAPGKTLGKTLAVELASADLAQLPDNAVVRLEIYKRVNGVVKTFILLGDGKLISRNYRMANSRNGLSISLQSRDSKLDKCPKDNLIVYDPAKGQVSTDELEPVATNTDELITTAATAVNVLTLYKLLNIAYLEGCEFASVETDIPNYEIARCDFSITNSFAAAVAQFIGQYEPIFFVDQNDNLFIQKTIDPLPPDYEPNPLPASKYSNFTETAEYPSAQIDGYTLIYTGVVGLRFSDRTVTLPTEPVGDAGFGDPDFVEESTIRKYRDWFEDGNPKPVRTELKQETVETRQNGVITGREIRIKNFDRLGRDTGYTNTIEARMPDVATGNAPLLLKTHEQSQKIAYKSNPYQPRQTVFSKIETMTKALLAVDAENTALDKNGMDSAYGQDYEKVFEAGNLKSGMTSEFKTLEVTVERFRPLPSGAVEVRQGGYDFLRGKPKPPITDTRTGDISTPNFQKQQVKHVFKSGVTQGTRTGKPLPPFNTGELPLIFAEPLADWLLANGRVKGNVEVIGFDESIERGVSFSRLGLNGENLGRFIIEGYRVSIDASGITTTLEALKV